MMPLGSSNDRDGHLRDALRSGGMLLLFVLFAMLTACAAPPKGTMATMTVTPTSTPTPKPTSTPMPSPTPWPRLGDVMGVKAGGSQEMIVENFSAQFEKMVGGSTILTGTEQTVDALQQEAGKWGLRLVVAEKGRNEQGEVVYVVGFEKGGVAYPYVPSTVGEEKLAGWSETNKAWIHYDGQKGNNVMGVSGLPKGLRVVAVVVANPLASEGEWGALRYAVFDTTGRLIRLIDPFVHGSQSNWIGWMGGAGPQIRERAIWEQNIPALGEFAEAREGRSLLVDLAMQYPGLQIVVSNKEKGIVRVKVGEELVEGYIRRGEDGSVWVEDSGGEMVAWLEKGEGSFVRVERVEKDGQVVYEINGREYVMVEGLGVMLKEVGAMLEEIRAMENTEWGAWSQGGSIVRVFNDDGKMKAFEEKHGYVVIDGQPTVVTKDEWQAINDEREKEGKEPLLYFALMPDVSKVLISDKEKYEWEDERVVYGGETVMRAGQNEAGEWGWWIPAGEGEMWVAKAQVAVSYVKVDEGLDNINGGLKNERVVVRVEVRDKAPAVVGDKEWVRWVYEEGEWYEVPEPKAVVALAEDIKNGVDVMVAMDNALDRLPSLEEAEVVPRAVLDIYLRQQAEVWDEIKNKFEVWAKARGVDPRDFQGIRWNGLPPGGKLAIDAPLFVGGERIIPVGMVRVGQEGKPVFVMSMPMIMKVYGGETRVKWFNFFVDPEDNDVFIDKNKRKDFKFGEGWERLRNGKVGNKDGDPNAVDIFWILARGYEGKEIGWGDEFERLVLENGFAMPRVRVKADGSMEVSFYPGRLPRELWDEILWWGVPEWDPKENMLPAVVVVRDLGQ